MRSPSPLVFATTTNFVWELATDSVALVDGNDVGVAGESSWKVLCNPSNRILIESQDTVNERNEFHRSRVEQQRPVQ